MPSGRVAFLTFHKCGSQWVRDVLTDPEVLALTGYRAALPGLDLMIQDWPDQSAATFAGPLYNASFDMWRAHAAPEDRAIIVLRDPRDVIVSTIYSFSYSHSADRYLGLIREPLLALGMRNRMLFGLVLFVVRSKAFRSWSDRPLSEREYLTSYERLIADAAGEFRAMLRFLGWAVPEETIERVSERHSFHARSGRERGSTDPYSHFRKGVAGDWRAHFDRSLGEMFESSVPGLLVRMGLEQSDEWWRELPGHVQAVASMTEDSGAAMHEARAELARAREQVRQLETVAEERLKLIQQLHNLGQEHLRIIEELKAAAAAAAGASRHSR